MAKAGQGDGKSSDPGARIARVRTRLRKARVPKAASEAAAASAASIVIADIALRAGSKLLRTAVDRGLRTVGGTGKPRFGQKLVTTTLAKVATRSVPGAIVVGGGLLAKTLYDRAHGRKNADTDTGNDGVEG